MTTDDNTIRAGDYVCCTAEANTSHAGKIGQRYRVVDVRPHGSLDLEPRADEHCTYWTQCDQKRFVKSYRPPCDHDLALAESLEVIRLAACPHLPADPKARKAIPLATGLLDYFPDALAAVAALSQRATDQHHPGEPVHWDRNKSADEADTLMRHFLDRGTIDTDGQRHSTKIAWRALALLQKELEAARAAA